MTGPPAATLCTSCGLCCDGSLHGHVTLLVEEVERARALGLPLLTDGRRGFSTPCPKLVGRRCSIYEVRPTACHGYKCQLLYDLEADRVSLSEALATVTTALGISAEIGRDPPVPPATGPIERARRTLRLTAFRIFLDRHFRNKYEGPMITQETVGTGEGAKA